jgi:hypothetical protein
MKALLLIIGVLTALDSLAQTTITGAVVPPTVTCNTSPAGIMVCSIFVQLPAVQVPSTTNLLAGTLDNKVADSGINPNQVGVQQASSGLTQCTLDASGRCVYSAVPGVVPDGNLGLIIQGGLQVGQGPTSIGLSIRPDNVCEVPEGSAGAFCLGSDLKLKCTLALALGGGSCLP